MAAIAGESFRAMWEDDVFVPAPGFERKMLSSWFDGLAGNEIIAFLAELGVIILLFQIGLESMTL